MRKKILLLDMDQVLVDFYSHPTLKIPKDSINHPSIYKKGYFAKLKPIPNALNCVRELIHCGKYDIYICTQPLATSPHSFGEKADWIKRYLPELEHKIIMTCNKNLVKGDILIDDSIKWKDFGGKFIHFNYKEKDFSPFLRWLQVIKELV